MIHLLEVNQDWRAQVGGECVHAAQLRTVGGDVKFHLAESLRSALHGLGERAFGAGLRHVGAVEPREAARRRRLNGPDLVEYTAPCEQIGFRDAGAVQVRDVACQLRTNMKMKIKDRRTPFVRRLLTEREYGRRGSHRFETFPAVQHHDDVAEVAKATCAQCTRKSRHRNQK
jgi:hypothetical protein